MKIPELNIAPALARQIRGVLCLALPTAFLAGSQWAIYNNSSYTPNVGAWALGTIVFVAGVFLLLFNTPADTKSTVTENA